MSYSQHRVQTIQLLYADLCARLGYVWLQEAGQSSFHRIGVPAWSMLLGVYERGRQSGSYLHP